MQTSTSASVSNTVQQPKLHLKLTLKQEQKPKEQQPTKKPNVNRRITWTQDTIDNQNMNKLKSNLCCIYHRPGSQSSDTCTSDDQANALERDRESKNKHKQKCSKRQKKCEHEHGHNHQTK